MLSWLAAVGEDVGVMATGFFEGVGQHREAVKCAVLVSPGSGASWLKLQNT
jgi:hypothetical protein